LYHGYRTATCDYLLITGHRRGCPVEGCTKHASSKRAQELSKHYAGLDGMRPSDEELLKLYEQGLSDTEIAAVFGKSKTLAAHWRRKYGLPAQREIEVEARDD
jgi:DNA-binding CsgD family transcriptional regulator